MNVPTIKFLCWTSALAMILCIVAYAVDFRRNLPQIQQPFDQAYLKKVLDEHIDVPVEVKDGISYAEVREQMMGLNWTGKLPPKPVKAAPVAEAPTGPIFRPVKDLVRLLMISVDTVDPGGSWVYVNYPDPATTIRQGTLKVGQKLPKPHDNVLVHQIRIDGIEFAFSDEGRDNEILIPGDDGREPIIHKTGIDGVAVPVRATLPKGRPKVNLVPEETRLVAKNTWELGTNDVDYFGENYAEILTRDVTTRVHIDENGKRAGIEMTSVKAGSVASRHGVQSGDILVSINGEPVKSEQEAIRYVKNNSDRYSVWDVEILRMGRLETHVYRSPDQ